MRYVVLYYSVHKHNIIHKTRFTISYMATCFGYIIAILGSMYVTLFYIGPKMSII
jgi:hypothetical protein